MPESSEPHRAMEELVGRLRLQRRTLEQRRLKEFGESQTSPWDPEVSAFAFPHFQHVRASYGYGYEFLGLDSGQR